MKPYEGKFDQGWDKLREETFARQQKLGVIPPDAKLTRKGYLRKRPFDPNAPCGRPLKDKSIQPDGFHWYPYYKVLEVAAITGLSTDTVRAIFGGGEYAPPDVLIYDSRNPDRRFRRQWRTILVSYNVLRKFHHGEGKAS